MVSGLPSVNSQQWSDPINISNSVNSYGSFPDICVDTSGVLHCVWRRKINSSNTAGIYYSHSEDQGDSWSNPQKISAGDDGWASDGMIVCDKSNKLYVVYKYDINVGGENIWFTKYNGQYWSTPVTIADDWPGMFLEEMTIDNNDRVYVFWRYFDHKFHYRYYENNVWSDVYTPYDTLPGSYFLVVRNAMCDDYNNLHCFGLYDPPNGSPTQTGYYFYNYTENKWYQPVLIGVNDSGDPFTDLTVYNNNPYLVWRETWGSSPWHDGTFYKYKTGEQWSETELIVEDPVNPNIDIIYDNVFIADEEKENDSDKIVFYKKGIFNQWEGQMVVFNDFIDLYDLFNDTEYLYILLTGKIDDENILDVYIMKTPIDSLIITSAPKIKSLDYYNPALEQNFPNPFTNNTEIDFELYNGGQTKLIIMNLQGKIVREFRLGLRDKGKNKIIWNGTDMAGNKLPAGTYYYRLIVDDRQKTKSLILK